MRPAAWLALLLTAALLITCPQIVTVVVPAVLVAALAAVGWLLTTPAALVAALAVTLLRLVTHRPEQRTP
ncbi:hypothetical protein OEIGOIKO_05784 [Streptomyces chrestomyceticus JCM 4735]|uniref:Uncharacterized protein n=1 Tax=Streptomyces chrestomyceticus JCM 4735 TaxID=1306181 RepID=A0A7U9Q326_9ACTN|nr:hypothetical protein [Streptomyces chrestomyceticus]GCD37974.1 hypothetical protein OEIGOIKO_05784 [Streptomyces chrestomyceticus JCM 4735]